MVCFRYRIVNTPHKGDNKDDDDDDDDDDDYNNNNNNNSVSCILFFFGTNFRLLWGRHGGGTLSIKHTYYFQNSYHHLFKLKLTATVADIVSAVQNSAWL
jgi:hypothetical protein